MNSLKIYSQIKYAKCILKMTIMPTEFKLEDVIKLDLKVNASGRKNIFTEALERCTSLIIMQRFHEKKKVKEFSILLTKSLHWLTS